MDFGRGERHIRGDVRPLLKQKWDLVIAHPPCTYLCNSGRRWLAEDGDRKGAMMRACEFFKQCLDANADRVCVENPIMMRDAVNRIGTDYTQIIQPWQFGEPSTKATCLWLKNLPPLVPTNVLEPHAKKAVVHRASPGRWRSKIRSLTPYGIARAMAEQWGTLNKENSDGKG